MIYQAVEVKNNVYRIGFNDRKTHLFENWLPLPQGVAYNSYLIVDEKIALVDTVEASYAGDFVAAIKCLIGNRKVDYLIINHMEPDHSGAIKAVLAQWPDIVFVGNKMTASLLNGYYQISDNYLKINDKQTLSLGSHTLCFYMTPWVHWPETMMTHIEEEKILFSGDAFGSFGTLDGGIFDDEINLSFYEDEMLRYYANIVGRYSDDAKKALDKLADVPVEMICSTHGPIWRTDLAKVLSLYQKWTTHTTENGVVIAFASMYGNTERMADYIARQLSQQGIRNIRIYDVSKTHMSYIIRDIWRYKGLLLGSCAYNGEAFPQMKYLLDKLIHLEVRNRFLGLFGSSGWNGAGVKALKDFAQNIEMQIIGEPAGIKGSLTDSTREQCMLLARNMSEMLHRSFS